MDNANNNDNPPVHPSHQPLQLPGFRGTKVGGKGEAQGEPVKPAHVASFSALNTI